MIIIILGIVGMGLSVIRKWDMPLLLSRRGYIGILVSAAVLKTVILCLTVREAKSSLVLLSVIGGCLILACATDLVLCQVYNFIWWIALAAAGILLWQNLHVSGMDAGKETMTALGVFFVLQFTVFCRTYGRADGYAFCVCAVTEAARGMKTAGFLFHMLLAYVLLFFVQLFCRNLDKRGNLKKPVPFLPYITITFWCVIALKKHIQKC